jgi:two-component system, chemotaxis family, sensor kinase CheA
MGEMDAIIVEFVQEGNEKADQFERHLIELEKHPNSRELLTEVFRVLHSIKGATSFLGFTKLCGLAHAGEGLLARLRDGAVTINPEVTSALLSLVDVLREMLSEIEATGQEGKTEYAALINTLTRLGKGG